MKYQSAILLSGLLSGEVSAQMFKKVKLKDVDVLTLYQGKMTNGRRSSPIPQLQVRTGLCGPVTWARSWGVSDLKRFFSVVVGVQVVLHSFLMWCSVIIKEVMV